MNKIVSQYAFVGVLLLGATPAMAASVLEDRGATTFDPDTHLEWLDLTATTNQSYNSVLAGFGSYTTTGGYRYATSAEVKKLYIDAGWDGVTSVSSSPLPGNAVAQTVLTLLSLLGVTAQVGIESTGDGLIVPITSNGGVHHTAFYDLVSRSSGYLAVLNPAFQDATDDFASEGLGSFLVRSSPVAATPLPAALPLFASALGVLGIAGAKRRTRRAG